MGPLIYLKNQKLYTVSLGRQVFISGYTTDWHYMMTAATVAVAPMISSSSWPALLHPGCHILRTERMTNYDD